MHGKLSNTTCASLSILSLVGAVCLPFMHGIVSSAQAISECAMSANAGLLLAVIPSGAWADMYRIPRLQYAETAIFL